jgi:pimeloyl-ACP methyl ester carboxylesterase
MKQSESFSNSLYTDEMHLAEHELSAFIAAVTELFGPEQARLSADDWLVESELMASPPRSTSRDWRTVTIAASARLATRLNVALHRQISLGTSRTDTKVSPIPSDLTAEERNAWDQLVDFYGKGLGYALEMSHRPQTLYGIVDSPVGLAAWMIDHDIRSYLMIARVFAGGTEGLSRDDVLDNVTLYWLTNTAISSARLYWDTTNKLPPGGFFDVRGVQLPVAVSAFADEIYTAPRSWAERAYPHLIHYNKLPRGTHFAAWEQPELFVAELRASFESLR